MRACRPSIQTVFRGAWPEHQCVQLRTSSVGVFTYSCFSDAAGFIFGKHKHSLSPDTCMSCRRSQCFCMGCTGGLSLLLVCISCEHDARSSSTFLHGRFKRRASTSVSSRSWNGGFSTLNSLKHACMCNAPATICIYTRCASFSVLIVYCTRVIDYA